jgi:TRAP-type mannitol/chloroaromatic compound transport system permease small subunit
MQESPAEEAITFGAPAAGKHQRRIEALVDCVGRAASWTVLALVALMATNVLLRYLFQSGSVWSQELEWHLLSPLVLFGMSYAMRHGEHVRVDLVYARLSARGQSLVDLVSAVLTILVALAIAWLSVAYLGQSFSIGETSADPGGLPYRWALKALIPVGFLVLALQGVAALLAAAGRCRAAA